MIVLKRRRKHWFPLFAVIRNRDAIVMMTDASAASATSLGKPKRSYFYGES